MDAEGRRGWPWQAQAHGTAGTRGRGKADERHNMARLGAGDGTACHDGAWRGSSTVTQTGTRNRGWDRTFCRLRMYLVNNDMM